MPNEEPQVVGSVVPPGDYIAVPAIRILEDGSTIKVDQYIDLETGKEYYASATIVGIGDQQQVLPFRIEADSPQEALEKAPEVAEERVEEVFGAEDLNEAPQGVADKVKTQLLGGSGGEEPGGDSPDGGGSILDLDDMR